jgi:hypothetical protein
MTELSPNRWTRAVMGILTAVAIAATPTAFAAPAGAAAAASPSCAVGAALALGGQSYCPGSTIGVRQTAYGVGKRVVLPGVTVLALRGTTVTVQGGPLCAPGRFCGAILTSVDVSGSRLTALPRAGTVIDLYGITTTGSLSATAVIDRGQSSCIDPDFC